MRTNHWRRLCVVSLGIFVILLLMGVLSCFRFVFGIDYGLISGILDVVIVIATTLVVIGAESTVAEKNQNKQPIEEKEEEETEGEAVVVPSDDGEVWILSEEGMLKL